MYIKIGSIFTLSIVGFFYEVHGAEQSGCTLTGGENVLVGWSGSDTGRNSCNGCNCERDGSLMCTLSICQVEEQSGCTLTGGENVLLGWEGSDTGRNWCNCSCKAGGSMVCTEMPCGSKDSTKVGSSTIALSAGGALLGLGAAGFFAYQKIKKTNEFDLKPQASHENMEKGDKQGN